jgi:hypothetical protein
VMLATGFTTGLAGMFPGQANVLDDPGRPRINGRESGGAGLFSRGYDASRGGVRRSVASGR